MPRADRAHAPGPRARRRGGRVSRHREAVLDVLAQGDRSLSVRQVYTELVRRNNTRIGLTTVYRLLHRFVDERLVTTVHAENGRTLYRLERARDRRRYLLCRRCGRAVAFSATRVEQYCERFAQHHGFAEVDVRIQVHGICERCGRSASRVPLAKAASLEDAQRHVVSGAAVRLSQGCEEAG